MSDPQVPPFRAEHIGSLLRPRSLLDQRARFARGEISLDDMRQAEDAAIIDAIRLQERLGFRFVTDGEFRRRSYLCYFYQRLGDLSIDAVPENEAATGRGAQPKGSVRSRVTWSGPINVADFQFLAANSTLVPKITIPGPCALHFRAGNAAVLASDFSPLRYLPMSMATNLGLVSTKSQAIEDKSILIDKIEQAVKYVPLERLSLSPQCGFASIDTGNPVTTQVQEAKLARVVEVARQVWGTA